MDTQNDLNREKKIREIAEVIYIENKKKGLPADSMKDWSQAEQIYEDKMRYLCWKSGQCLRKYYYKLIAVAVLLIIFFSAADIKVGQDLKEMGNRPYLSVDLINPMQISDADTSNTYYGSYIILKNSGKTPAAGVTVFYYMTTEEDGKKTMGTRRADQKAEGISTLGFVAPGGFVKEPSFRSLSPAASYYYFEAVASYHGLNAGKRYWTQIKRVFKIDRTSQKLVPIYNYSEWDENQNFAVPALSAGKDIGNLFAKLEKK